MPRPRPRPARWLPALLGLLALPAGGLGGGPGLGAELQQLRGAVLDGGPRAGRAYAKLAAFCDRFGHRLAGSAHLEAALDHLVAALGREFGAANVKAEPAMVPHWVRGRENATLVAPLVGAPTAGRQLDLRMLGLGKSVGTGGAPVEAEVLVVKDHDDLIRRGEAGQVEGKIVVWNWEKWEGYGKTVKYRYSGADWASEHGAVASLVKSITPFSLNSPHTGTMAYSGDQKKIPAGALTLEDVEMLQRMQDRGTPMRIRLCMEAENLPESPSRNVVVDIPGAEKPDEIVLLSGHIDSWDVGQGAMDDGGGAFVSWEALSLIKSLGIQPKRTIRAIFWTAEEVGGGAKAYWAAHGNDTSMYSAVFESDSGVFSPLGLQLSGSLTAHARLRAVLEPLRDLGWHRVITGGGGADISPAMKKGVPGLSLYSNEVRDFRDHQLKNANSHGNSPHFQGQYFFYHHSHADTMSVLDSGQMDNVTLLWASAALGLAEEEEMLPRGEVADNDAVTAEFGGVMDVDANDLVCEDRVPYHFHREDKEAEMVTLAFAVIVGLVVGALITLFVQRVLHEKKKRSGQAQYVEMQPAEPENF